MYNIHIYSKYIINMFIKIFRKLNKCCISFLNELQMLRIMEIMLFDIY